MTEGQPRATAGSVINPDALREQVQTYRQEQWEAAEKAKNEAEKAGEAATEAEAAKKYTVLGKEYTLEELITKYPSIWEQISNKQYYTRKFVEAEVSISDALTFKLRTLDRQTRAYLTRIFDKNEESSAEIGALERYNELQLICMLHSMGKEVFPDIREAVKEFLAQANLQPDVTRVREQFKTFLDTKAVKARQEAINELPEHVYQILVVAGLSINEIVYAFLLKDSENPFVIR